MLLSISMRRATMIQNPVTLVHKSPLLFSFVSGRSLSVKPTSHFGSPTRFRPLNSVKISGFRSFSSTSQYPVHLHSAGHRNTQLGQFGNGFRQLSFRPAGVSNGGSGGDGGSDFGGAGGSGGGDGGGGGNKWSLLAWYLSLLEKHPMLTKAVTSAILTFVGDLICQLMIDEVPSLDLKRIFTFTFLGLVLVGPTLHFWYLYLSKLVTMTGASGALLRLVIDQFVFAPIFIGVFLSTLITLEGRPAEVMPKLQQEWLSSVLANWQLWIPFQFLNFRFVPQQFQVLAANFIALVWNVILSYKAHKEVVAK